MGAPLAVRPSKAAVTSAPRARARSGALVLAVASFLAASRAVAGDEVLVSLDYDTAPDLIGCPSAAEFRQQVTRQLRRDPFRDGASRRLAVRLYTTGERLGGRIEWRDTRGDWEGERTFSSRNESCAAMARAIELATAIQIELLATLTGGPASESLPSDLVEETPPPPTPPSPVRPVIKDAKSLTSSVPRDPFFGVSLGVGVVRDFGDAPSFFVPRIAVLVGRPQVFAVRLAASGLGPGAQVSGLEGTAQLDRFVGSLDAVRSFRSDWRIQPLVTAGVGVQDVRIRGTSAMPSVAAGHDGQRVTGFVVAGGGVGFVLARRLSLLLEGDALFFRPSVTVKNRLLHGRLHGWCSHLHPRGTACAVLAQARSSPSPRWPRWAPAVRRHRSSLSIHSPASTGACSAAGRGC